MAQPPRLKSILLPWQAQVVYFVTLCLRDRRPLLANASIFAEIEASLKELRRWHVWAAVVMPDHLHAIVAPKETRELSVGDFSTGFKRTLRKRLGSQSWDWQRGCFDRLLRSEESAWEKWQYLRENPVRHGLVGSWHEWPYFFVAEGYQVS